MLALVARVLVVVVIQEAVALEIHLQLLQHKASQVVVQALITLREVAAAQQEAAVVEVE